MNTLPRVRSFGFASSCLLALTNAHAVSLTVDLDTAPGSPQSALSAALEEFCPQLAALSERNAEQENLAQLCAALSDGAADPGQRQQALTALSARAASSETTAATYLPGNVTINAAGGQFAALRKVSEQLSWLRPWHDQKIPLQLAAADTMASDAISDGGNDSSRLSAFLSLDSGSFTQDDTPFVSGMDGSSGGFALGADYRVGGRLFTGAALNYLSHDADLNDGGTLSATGNGLSLYGNYAFSDNTEFGAVLAWGQQAYELSRRVAFNLGSVTVDQQVGSKPKGSSLGLSLSGGWQTNFGGTGLAVNGTFYYANQTIDGFTETDGQGYGLRVDGQEINTTRLNIGGMVHHAFSTGSGVITPQLSLTWLHEFATDGQDITARFLADPSATPFHYNTQQRDPDYLQLALGVPVMFTGGFSAFLQYQSVLALENYTANTLTLGARMEF